MLAEAINADRSVPIFPGGTTVLRGGGQSNSVNNRGAACQWRINTHLECGVARLEALLTGAPELQEMRPLLEQLSPGAGGTFTWLDRRNASLALLPGSISLPVRVLLEIRDRGELALLLSSREGMTRGAPLSHGVLEQVLAQLLVLIPTAAVAFRSDQDGPLDPAHAAAAARPSVGIANDC